MRCIYALAVLLAALAALHSPYALAAGSTRSVVYPTGVYPDDVDRVQAAVDRGGVVTLKAVNAAGRPTAFNFGTGLPVGQSGGVILNKAVTLLGETLRNHRTTILGGFLPIQVFQPVNTTIQGIVFQSPFFSVVNINASTGSAIIDNEFHDIVPVNVTVPSGAVITFAQAIGFSGYGDSGPQPDLISGHLLIAGNTIDGAQAVFSNGIQLDSFNADVEITGNTIRNVNDDTTQTGSGIAVIRAHSSVTIVGNQIAPGPTQNIGADGIFIGGDREARYWVIGNAIDCVAEFCDGIDVAGGDPTGTTGTVKAQVLANLISLDGDSAAGIVIWDLVTQADVAANLIRGSGLFALGISTYGFDTDTASQNRFVDNDLRGFSGGQSDLFYDTNTLNNAEIGFCRTVLDLGHGNTSGCAPHRASASKSAELQLASPAALAGPVSVTPPQRRPAPLGEGHAHISVDQVSR